MGDGEDLRKLPLSMRKTNLARLLARRVDGIHLAPFEQGEIGPDLFRHACLMGLELGLVEADCDIDSNLYLHHIYSFRDLVVAREVTIGLCT